MSYESLQNRRNFIISLLGEDYIPAGLEELRYQCPFCRDQGLRYDDYKMYVNARKGLWWCHRCESKGKIEFDPLLTSGSNTEVYDQLDKWMNSVVQNQEIKKEDEEESDYFLIPSGIPMPNTLAWDYLISRGINPSDMSFYSIRIPGLNDPKSMFSRIVIPNRVISNIWTDMYVARTYIDDKVRYKNPSSSKAHDLVFNLHRIPQNPDRIIINEGAINSIIAGRDSVATFGKHVSDSQLMSILAKNPKKIYVSLDVDAREIAEDLCNRLVSYGDAEVYLVELPTDDKHPKGLDASDLGRQHYLEIVNSARRYTKKSIFLIEKFIEELGGK